MRVAYIVVFGAFAARLTCFALLPSAWLALPVELLAALTQPLDQLLSNTYLSAHSPRSAISTLLSLGKSMHFGAHSSYTVYTHLPPALPVHSDASSA